MNHTNLFELCKPQNGYRFSKFVGCTYSADDSSITELKRALGVDLGVVTLGKFERGETAHLFVAQGHFKGEVNNYICAVSGKALLHAKVYAIEYSNGVDNYLRVIVASANLTNADELNVYTYEDYPNQSIEMVDDVTDFLAQSKNIIQVDKNILQTLVGATVIVSPFLTEGTVKRIFSKPTGNKILISRKDDLDNLSDDCKTSGIQFYVLSEDDDNPAALHSKMYIFNDHLYLGSANCTHSAFHSNIETLVKVDATVDIDDFLKDYAPYMPQKNAGVLDVKKDFDRTCRTMINSFAYRDSLYWVSGTLAQGITVTLDNQPGSPSTWSRTNPHKHMVTLKISNGTYGDEFLIFIDGKPIAVDEQALQQTVTQSIVGALKLSKSATASGAMGKKAANSKSKPASDKVPDIISTIYQVKTEADAKKMIENIDGILQSCDKSYKETLRNAKKALQNIWP